MNKPRLPAGEEKAIKAERRARVIEIMEAGGGEYMRPQVIAAALEITLMSASGLLKDMWKDRVLDATQCLNATNTSNENHYRIKQKSMLSTPWRKHPNYHPMPSRWKIGAPI